MTRRAPFRKTRGLALVDCLIGALAMGLLGYGLVAAGVWWVYPPAALIISGVFLLLESLDLSRQKFRRRDGA